MAADRGGDAGFPAMGNDLSAVELAKIGDAADLGQPAAAADIGLHHGDPAALEPLADLEARGGRLRTADPDWALCREARMAGQVVMLQRRLGEIDVAVRDPVEHPFGVVPAGPA